MEEKVIIKCIVISELGNGARSLIMAMVEKKFPLSLYLPMTGINPSDYHVVSRVDDCCVDMQFWYCSGGDEYDRLRPLGYHGAHVVLLCFALNKRKSLERMRDKYIQEIRRLCGRDIPVILVGTKSDLRGADVEEGEHAEEGQVTESEFVTFKEGQATAAKMGAISYIECSALKLEWLDLITRQASQAGYYHWKNEEMKKLTATEKRSCHII